MLQLLLKFAFELLSGDVYRIWQQHKLNEAKNAQNNVNSLSDADLDKRVLSDITRR